MANEILKDEILSEEELDNVAGGTIVETASDGQFLRDCGVVPNLGNNFGNHYVESPARPKPTARTPTRWTARALHACRLSRRSLNRPVLSSDLELTVSPATIPKSANKNL